jgi:single-stranded-DNA-specific exonuclease
LKRWAVHPPIPQEAKIHFGDIHPVIAQVLYNRGIKDYQTAIDFLDGKDPQHNAMHMKGMQNAIVRIRQAIRKKENIVIYGDFDADGVTSTALLVQTLTALGANVKPYIPHRVDEGYGLNTPALLQMAGNGTDLVITVDCGVRSVEEVKTATEAGLDIIITDHHSIGDEIPPALAVINPKQEDCPYPEAMLAGVGIAFRLAEMLIKVETANSRTAPTITREELLDLVAIGTVADLAPLDRLENRSLVLQGLEELNKARRPGIYELLQVSGVEPGSVDATAIGYSLGPRINAAGRLESAMIAYQLLSTSDINEAKQLADTLQELNTQRQELTLLAQDEARDLALSEAMTDLPLIFAAAPHFKPGIVGLVAGRLAEEFYRPAIVIEQGEEESRGSCRSIPEVNITEVLDECADLLLRHGGHAQAAGFTIKTSNIPAFREKLMELIQKRLHKQIAEPTLVADARVPLSFATLELAQQLHKLEPTGFANSLPLFVSERLRVVDYKGVGKEGKHLKLRLSEGPISVDAIGFGLGQWARTMPMYVDVAYYLQVNEWNGRVAAQLNVQDIKPAGT